MFDGHILNIKSVSASEEFKYKHKSIIHDDKTYLKFI